MSYTVPMPAWGAGLWGGAVAGAGPPRDLCSPWEKMLQVAQGKAAVPD